MRNVVRWLWNSELPAVVLMVVLAMVALGAGLTAFTYAQGSGIGTLPNRSVSRTVPWLTYAQTCTGVKDGSGATFMLVSGDTGEGEAPVTGANDPQTMTYSWRWHGGTMTVSTPRWANEVGDEGAAHQAARHAQAVAAAMRQFPPDGTMARLLVGPWGAYRLVA